jgi:Rod binding domain-containing protein
MLFSHDQQMHSSLVKKYPGIGLNLMLVKQVIEAQGGIVGALNVDDSSCIFHALFCSDNA